MNTLKQIVAKIRSLEFELSVINVGVLLVAIVAVGGTVWGVLRVLHNESFLPYSSSGTVQLSAAESNGVPATLPSPSSSDNQTLDADLTVLQRELTQSGANINNAASAVDGQAQ